MSLRRLETAAELSEAESLASDWSESPHHPSLTEAARIQMRAGQAIVFVGDDPQGIVALTSGKRRDVATIEVAVPSAISASDFWDAAESAVLSEAWRSGYRDLELLTWDPAFQHSLPDRGWRAMRQINRGALHLDGARLPASGGTPPGFASLLGRETDIDGLIEVNNLAFAEHPDAGDWDRPGLERLFAEPWFDPAGLLISRDGPSTIIGFCWTKVHPDGVGEIYVLAVRPGYIGHGLGRALVGAGIDHLSSRRDCRDMIVYWEATNTVATHLYQSIGFSIDRVGEIFQHGV
jgi:mycothiol synthase